MSTEEIKIDRLPIVKENLKKLYENIHGNLIALFNNGKLTFDTASILSMYMLRVKVVINSLKINDYGLLYGDKDKHVKLSKKHIKDMNLPELLGIAKTLFRQAYNRNSFDIESALTIIKLESMIENLLFNKID